MLFENHPNRIFFYDKIIHGAAAKILLCIAAHTYRRNKKKKKRGIESGSVGSSGGDRLSLSLRSSTFYREIENIIRLS